MVDPRALLAGVVLMLALAGCGGPVSVQGGLSGVSAPTPSTPAPSAPSAGRPSQGFNASSGRGLGLAIVVGLVVADLIHWTAENVRQALSTAALVKECE